MPDVKSCFAELLRTGRLMGYNERTVGVTNTSQVAFLPNPYRVRLLTGGIDGNRVTISFGRGLPSSNGIIIATTTQPLILKIEDFGNLLTQTINVILNVAGPTPMWLAEVFLQDTSP